MCRRHRPVGREGAAGGRTPSLTAPVVGESQARLASAERNSLRDGLQGVIKRGCHMGLLAKDWGIQILEALSTGQFARVVKGVDLRSTAGNYAWVRTP